eukprot:762009-Hanusia_phi.AAC.2
MPQSLSAESHRVRHSTVASAGSQPVTFKLPVGDTRGDLSACSRQYPGRGKAGHTRGQARLPVHATVRANRADHKRGKYA